MQLFITEYQKQSATITISNPDILSQVRKVLRAKIGDIIWMQSPKNEAKKIRYELQITSWNDKDIQGKILSEHLHESTPEQTGMIVAMPNKWEKAELIVQKLSEIGISKIIFWPSERSVLKDWNSKKEERLQKIIKEAVEQSRGWKMPELIFTTSPKTLVGENPLVIFDKQTGESSIKKSDAIYGLIGPEGGLTPRDYQTFEGTKSTVYGLGETVLRMETAAIVGGWIVKRR